MKVSWLREVPDSRENRHAAERKLHSFRHFGWPEPTLAHPMRCPGCRTSVDLVLLEFRNGIEPGDTYKNTSILAVCRVAAKRLMWLKGKGEVFGITALVKMVPWACAKKAERATPKRVNPNPAFLETLQRARAAKKGV